MPYFIEIVTARDSSIPEVYRVSGADEMDDAIAKIVGGYQGGERVTITSAVHCHGRRESCSPATCSPADVIFLDPLTLARVEAELAGIGGA